MRWLRTFMGLSFLLKGIVIGFSIALPVGPIGILCIKRTLSEGRLHGFVSGLGAATADAVYGSIAGFGLTYVSGLLVNQGFWLRLTGGVFLCLLGAKAFLSKPKEQPVTMKETRFAGAYVSTFLLTIANPMTILSFAAIFAGLGMVNVGTDYSLATILVLGVFLGSMLWWLTLSTVIGMFRRKFNHKMLVWANRFSGVVITAFGFAALVSLFLGV